jgi:hypothetical protein
MREHDANTHRALTQEVAQGHAPTLLTTSQILAKAIWARPIRCGIYFLIRGGVIVYVGQTIDLHSRLVAHTKSKTFDSWAWKAYPPGRLNAMERAYIDALMPEENMDPMTVRMREQSIPPPLPPVPRQYVLQDDEYSATIQAAVDARKESRARRKAIRSTGVEIMPTRDFSEMSEWVKFSSPEQAAAVAAERFRRTYDEEPPRLVRAAEVT